MRRARILGVAGLLTALAAAVGLTIAAREASPPPTPAAVGAAPGGRGPVPSSSGRPTGSVAPSNVRDPPHTRRARRSERASRAADRAPIRSEDAPPALTGPPIELPRGADPNAHERWPSALTAAPSRAPGATELDPGRRATSATRSAAGAPRGPDAGSPDAGAPPELIMYATEWCPVCTRARRWMTAEEIEFEERDVEQDPAAARRHTELNPRRTVPTFERGEHTLVGFSPEALRGLLASSP